MTARIVIASSLFFGIAMLLLPSAQAMSPPPIYKSDGMSTQARYVGHGYRGRVARGYGGYRHRGYGGYRHYGYGGYRHYGYRSYGYGVARRQVRRCALWGVGHVCRRWY